MGRSSDVDQKLNTFCFLIWPVFVIVATLVFIGIWIFSWAEPMPQGMNSATEVISSLDNGFVVTSIDGKSEPYMDFFGRTHVRIYQILNAKKGDKQKKFVMLERDFVNDGVRAALEKRGWVFELRDQWK